MERPNIHFWFLWLTLLRLFARAEHGVITDVSDETFEFLISGGHKQTLFRWSRHVVSIRTVSYLKTPGDNHFCAGILISSRAVLTAAHCLTDRYKATLKPRGIQVVFGHYKRLDSYNVNDDSRIADRLMVHPGYERYVRNDLAIIRLKDRIPSYHPDVQPIVMRRKANFSSTNTCLTMGWGQLYEHGPYSDEILYLKVNVTSSSECIRESGSISEDEICVRPDINGKMCAGDMGGPLICDGALVGIIAGSLGCSEGQFIKFVSFPYYRDWVQKIVNDFKNDGVTLTMGMLMLCGGWLVSQLYQLLPY